MGGREGQDPSIATGPVGADRPFLEKWKGLTDRTYNTKNPP